MTFTTESTGSVVLKVTWVAGAAYPDNAMDHFLFSFLSFTLTIGAVADMCDAKSTGKGE